MARIESRRAVPPGGSGPSAGRRSAALAAGLLIAGLTAAGCTTAGGQPQNVSASREAIGSSPSQSLQVVDAAALLADPAAHDGQEVTVTGTVRILAPFMVALTPTPGGTASPSAGAASPTTGATSGAAPTVASPTSGAPSGTPSGTPTATGPVEPLRSDELLVVYGLPEGPPGGGPVTVTGTFHRSFDASLVLRQLNVTLDRLVVDAARLESKPPFLMSDTVGKTASAS